MEPLQVRVESGTPWADNLVDPRPFPAGCAQRAVAECAATKYSSPRLADIGGFFFHAVPKRRSVAEGCADFSKPFVLPAGSTFKDVGGRANVVTVIYVPDPVGMLMPAQVAKYAADIGHINSVTLPLRPDAAVQPTWNWELGNSSSTPSPRVIDGTISPTKSDEDNARIMRRRATMSTSSLAAHLNAASSEESDSCHVLSHGSPSSDSRRSPPPLSATSSPPSATQSGLAGGADRAAEALAEAEDAFMVADSKYNIAREAQDWDSLDLNEPFSVSAADPQTTFCLVLPINN